MTDATHPIWAIARTAVALICITFLLWLNASNFDETEFRTIIWMIPVLAGSEVVPKVVSAFRRQDSA